MYLTPESSRLPIISSGSYNSEDHSSQYSSFSAEKKKQLAKSRLVYRRNSPSLSL